MVRSDARRNRDRILAAAREAFAEDGDPSMNQIAQRAGVGPGTLYRNYPSREALVLDIYQEEVKQLIGSVSESLTTQTPLEALRSWTTVLVDAMRKKHVLGPALTPGLQQAVTEVTHGPPGARCRRFWLLAVRATSAAGARWHC